ncbi:MAG: energy-coupling factor transporter transmembrane component T [Actinomycetes bacterium]
MNRPGAKWALRQRWLHPGAWWLWALGLAAAASRTTNPFLLLLIIGTSGYVVAARRPATAWGASFGAFLRVGAFVIALRLGFAVLIGLPIGTHLLFTLPEVGLPSWAQGIRLGGPVTAEQVLLAAADGLRLATMFACLGAANSLASPSRLLKALPTALYEAGVAVVVALTFAPQLVTDVSRIRTARRLRGRSTSGVRGFAGAAIPVLTGALDRSILLAAAMDSRGFGRTAEVSVRSRRVTSGLILLGLVGIGVGVGAGLDAGTPPGLALPLALVGTATAGLGLRLGARRGLRSRYRPDPWTTPEWLTVASGFVGPIVLLFTATDVLNLSVTPLTLPALALSPVVGLLIAIAPAFFAPAPPDQIRRAARDLVDVRVPATVEPVAA